VPHRARLNFTGLHSAENMNGMIAIGSADAEPRTPPNNTIGHSTKQNTTGNK